MRKCIFIFLLAPVFALTAFAQNKVNSNEGKISGNILNEKNQALSFATVLLLKAGDSTLVKSSVSNDKGGFIFEELPAGPLPYFCFICWVSKIFYD
ncbi:MAG: carboxypeptidase-like regulatory domain-containing protein [Chitinophagaceae bacterium]